MPAEQETPPAPGPNPLVQSEVLNNNAPQQAEYAPLRVLPYSISFPLIKSVLVLVTLWTAGGHETPGRLDPLFSRFPRW